MSENSPGGRSQSIKSFLEQSDGQNSQKGSFIESKSSSIELKFEAPTFLQKLPQFDHSKYRGSKTEKNFSTSANIEGGFSQFVDVDLEECKVVKHRRKKESSKPVKKQTKKAIARKQIQMQGATGACFTADSGTDSNRTSQKSPSPDKGPSEYCRQCHKRKDYDDDAPCHREKQFDTSSKMRRSRQSKEDRLVEKKQSAVSSRKLDPYIYAQSAKKAQQSNQVRRVKSNNQLTYNINTTETQNEVDQQMRMRKEICKVPL